MNAYFFNEMRKIAEDEKKFPLKELAKIVAKGALGIGVGTGVGLLAGHGADLLSKKITGHELPASSIYGVMPLLGGGLGLAYNLHKAKEQESINRVLQDSTNARAR